MLVTLTNTEAITGYLPVSELTWACSASREYGVATIAVPIDSAAYDEAYVNPEGGSYVEISDPILGDWEGVVSDVKGDQEGLELSCVEARRVATVLPLLQSRTFYAVPAGTIALQAAIDTLVGLGRLAFTLGTFCVGGPPVSSQTGKDTYSYDASSTLDTVLSDLMSQTGQEWEIRSGAINWLPRVGGVYNAILVEGNDVVDLTWEANAADRVARVTVIPSGTTNQSVIAPEVAATTWWPAHKIISSNSLSDPANALLARQTLDQSRWPIVTLEMKLAASHWPNVREGDLITVLSTYAGIGGRLLTCRVLTRTYSETDAWLTLTVEVITPLTSATITKAAAERPIPTSGKASTTINSPLRSLVIPEARKVSHASWTNIRDF